MWPAAAALGLSAAMLVVIGCDSGRDREPDAEPGSASGTAQAAPAAGPAEAPDGDGDKLMQHWPTGPSDKFAGAIIISGQMIGYLEPCGCSAKQKGGLVRRAEFMEKLRKQGWDLAAVDLGTLVADPGHDRGGPEQAKIKYNTTLKALMQLGYDAVALSADDLRLGTDEVLMQYVNTLPEASDAMKFVSANVRPSDQVAGIGFEQRIQPSVRTQVGPIKVGVTAVFDPEKFKALNDQAKNEFLTILPPEECLSGVLGDLEKDTNVQILMVQGPPEMALEMARKYPGFEVVVGTSHVPDPPKDPEVVNDGKTWLITVGQKGMYLGVLGLYQDAKQKLRYQRIDLNDRYDKYAALAGPMKSLIGDELQASLKNAGVLERFPKRPYSLFDAPTDATFVGAETCKSCHPGTYAKWASTKHAHAYEPLIEDPHQPGRNREHDASCVSCHTTGFEYVGGFVDVQQTPTLKGNQCENCHGPGSKHAANPDDKAILKSIAREASFFEKNFDYGCVRCHDGDNDPDFNFATYWPQIMHKGLDKYDDPKVHQGVDAKPASGAAE
jgi:hypothetical protein